MEQNKCNKCGRPMQYATEPKCNYCDSCMSEHCGCKLGRIKEMEPTCDSTAVIPSVTVESVEGITNLANCLVHVEDINTTFYVDDKHRVMITWAGPVDIPGYDMKNNPNGYRDQIVTDIESETAVIYDKHGNGFLFGITDGNLQMAVNNKINRMIENGTFASIVATYLEDTPHSFDTVADMKTSTDLLDGAYAKTLGYYAKDDMGGAYYKISSTVPSGHYETLTSGLYAELILEDTMNVRQFGAKGDGVTDDKNAIQNALNTRSKIIIPESTNPYMISGVVQVYNDVTFYGTLKMIGTTGLAGTSCLLIQDYRDDKILHITNPLIDGNRDTTQPYERADIEFSHGIDIKGSKNLLIEGGSIINCQGDSICINASPTNRWCENIEINNLYCDQPFRNCLSIVSGVNIRINNCRMYNRNGYRCTLVEPNPDGTLKNGNIVFDGGYYYGDARCVMGSYALADIDDITYKNLTIENSDNCNLPINNSQPNPINTILHNLTIENVTIITTNTLTELPLRVSDTLRINGLKINNPFNYMSIYGKNITIERLDIDIDTDYETGSVTVNGKKVIIHRCRFNYKNKTSSFFPALYIVSPEQAIVDSNLFLNNRNAVGLSVPQGQTATIDSAIITNNVFTAFDATNRHGVNIMNGVTVNQLIVTDNIIGENLSNLYYIVSGTVVKGIGNNITNASTYYDTMAPTSGNYIVGDIVINKTPTAGGAYGWVCTTAGSPGTWKEISTIEA